MLQDTPRVASPLSRCKYINNRQTRQRLKAALPNIALFIGLFIVTLGAAGIVVPELFMTAFRAFQVPPVLYAMAAFRVVAGVVLLLAAPASRLPWTLRTLGSVIAIAGALTPFLGGRLAQFVLESASMAGPFLPRVWAGVALAVGFIVVYAVAPARRGR